MPLDEKVIRETLNVVMFLQGKYYIRPLLISLISQILSILDYRNYIFNEYLP